MQYKGFFEDKLYTPVNAATLDVLINPPLGSGINLSLSPVLN